jgi:hypothetical protein
LSIQSRIESGGTGDAQDREEQVVRTPFRWLAMALMLAAAGCTISPRRLVVGGGPGSSGNSEFSVTVSPTSQIITAGNTGSYTVSVQAINGFSGTVSLSASAANSNVVASFNPPSVQGTGSSTLTITTSSATPATTTTITITGADSNTGQSSSVSVTAVIQGGVSTMGEKTPGECVNATAGAGIQSTGFSPVRTAGFSATFAATPSASVMESDIGFSSRSAEGRTAFAGLIRFSRTGTVLVRDGDSFSAVSRVRYVAGETYHFRLVEDLPAVSYTVFVTPPGGTEVLLGSNLEVPAEQRGSPALEGWGAEVHSPGGAALTVCSFTLR